MRHVKQGELTPIQNRNFSKGEWAEGYQGVALNDGGVVEWYSFTPAELAAAKLRALKNKEDFEGLEVEPELIPQEQRKGCLNVLRK